MTLFVHSCWTCSEYVYCRLKYLRSYLFQGTHKFSCSFNRCTYALLLYTPHVGAYWNSLASQAKKITDGCLLEESAWMVQIFRYKCLDWSYQWLKFHLACALLFPAQRMWHDTWFDNVMFWCFCLVPRVPPFCMVKGFYPEMRLVCQWIKLFFAKRKSRSGLQMLWCLAELLCMRYTVGPTKLSKLRSLSFSFSLSPCPSQRLPKRFLRLCDVTFNILRIKSLHVLSTLPCFQLILCM